MSDPSAQRTLPHNLEAERSVLGAILIENLSLFVAMALISAKDFFRDSHRRIFKAMVELSEAHIEIDLVTLKERLEVNGDLEECGGPAYLASLVDGVPRSTNVGWYAGIVRETAGQRNVIFAANKMIGLAYEREALDELLQHADEMLFDIRGNRISSRMAPVGAGIAELHKDLEWLSAHPGELTGLPTGSGKLDAQTHGWQAGDMIIVAARPSMGKTALVLNTATAMARAGKGRVAIFSLEMRAKQLNRRLWSMLSNVPLRQILRAQLDTMEWKALADAQEQLAELPIEIDDTPSRTVWDIRSQCRQMQAEQAGLSGVIIDYVQLMSAGDDRRRRNDNRTQELTDISRRLKVLAGELNVPLLVLSQLVRLGENERPQIHHLRESGSLEQDADMILLMHGKSHLASGVRELNVAKARNNDTGMVMLQFERDVQRFTDAPDAPAEPEAPEAEKPKRQARKRSPNTW